MSASNMKKAFTLVELMAVIAIIGILLGIVTTAAANNIKASRNQRANAICASVKHGLDTYYAQKDRWPGSIGDRIENDGTFSQANDEGVDSTTDYEKYVLTAGEVRDMVKTVVMEAVNNGNAMIDISALYVSRDPGEANGRGYGMNFLDAVHGTRESPKKMSVGEMYFGYPEANHGYFRRFKIVYSIPGNSMEVTKQ